MLLFIGKKRSINPLEYPRTFYTDLNSLICKVLDGPLTSADDLGRLEEHGRGNREAESLRGLHVDDQLK